MQPDIFENDFRVVVYLTTPEGPKFLKSLSQKVMEFPSLHLVEGQEVEVKHKLDLHVVQDLSLLPVGSRVEIQIHIGPLTIKFIGSVTEVYIDSCSKYSNKALMGTLKIKVLEING